MKTMQDSEMLSLDTAMLRARARGTDKCAVPFVVLQLS